MGRLGIRLERMDKAPSWRLAKRMTIRPLLEAVVFLYFLAHAIYVFL